MFWNKQKTNKYLKNKWIHTYFEINTCFQVNKEIFKNE